MPAPPAGKLPKDYDRLPVPQPQATSVRKKDPNILAILDRAVRSELGRDDTVPRLALAGNMVSGKDDRLHPQCFAAGHHLLEGPLHQAAKEEFLEDAGDHADGDNQARKAYR